YGLDRRGRPAQLDLRRLLAAEQVEQQLPWRPRDAGSGLSPPRPDGLAGARPLEFKACAAQPPGEEPAPAPDVVPQCLVQGRLVPRGATAVGSAHVLVMDEELVEARQPAHPPDAEEARRWPRPERRGEPGEVPPRERCLPPFGEVAPRAGHDEP